MADKRISELVTIATVDLAMDLFPIVDSSAAETKKITPIALKTSLALNNVDNTSDLNKPISTLTQGALDNKQATLISGSNIKTINSTTILGGGNLQVAPATGIDATAIATGVVSNAEFETLNGVTSAIQVQLDAKQATITGGATSIASADLTVSRALVSNAIGKVAVATTTSTELGYVNGVTSAIQTQLDAKQATLISATNIKTINGTSLLGSGDIIAGGTPSGVAGAIQFTNGSAFASDAANLFWDDTNNRLGIGTNAPTALVHVKGASGILIDNSDDTILAFAQNGITKIFMGWDSANLGMYWYTSGPIMNLSNAGNLGLGGVPLPTARLQIKGSGSTSATTSLLVQNSAGTQTMKLDDSGRLFIDANNYISSGGEWRCDINFVINGTLQNSNSGYVQLAKAYALNGLVAGTTTLNASAILQANSTTQGFLPPRMTTTEKNAIASPAAGLVVYDSTTNKLCCYNGSTWNDLF
jgi:hypothetical protein